MQNPPWERKDEFDIDVRPKKRRRVSDRWFFEIVYPEGKGPEDYQDLEEQEETSRSSKSQSSSKRNSRVGTPRDLSPARALSRKLSPSFEQSANGARVNDPISVTSLERSRRQKSSDLLQYSLSSEDSQPLDELFPASQSPCTPEKAVNSPTEGFVTSTRDLELPTLKEKLPQPNQTTTSPQRPAILTTSSPLSSLGSSPVLSPGIQLATFLGQSEDTSEQSSLESFEPSISINPYSSHQKALQKEDSGYRSSESDDERTALDSSQASSRPLRNFKGRDLFDSIIWADPYSTSIFYMFITSFRQKVFNDVKSTSPAHKFIKTLRDGGRLVRNYTQNIDSLEEREGLATDLSLGPGSRARFNSKTQRERRPSDIGGDSSHRTGVECVQLHGSLVSLRCGLCSKLSRWDEAERESTTLSGQAPDCPSCTEYNARRTGRGRRGLAVGRLRPDIVLYGEEHPNANLVAPLITHDLGLGPDVLLIMGTSLKVHGLKIMVKEFAKAVHSKGGKVIFVNRTKPPESTWGDVIDYWVEWDCDAWVLDLKERRGDIWLPQSSTTEEAKNRRELSREDSREAKPKPDARRTSRPQATRDDKMSGVYHTFKILDSLRSLSDGRGHQANRSSYWQKPTRMSMPAAPTKEPTRKGTAAPTAKKESSGRARASKRRKSHPSTVRDDNHELEKIAFLTKQWEQLRTTAPSLPTKIPESVVQSGRVVLAELKANLPSFLTPFKFTFTPGGYSKGTSSHLPNLRGLSLPVGMNLISHPPSGATLPLHSPRTIVESKPMNHAYGTRAAHRFSSESTLIADGEFSAEDTIIVAPMTPNSKRIKRMGSLGKILSSSPEIYHDAEEGSDETRSGSSQEFHDAIEWCGRTGR